MAARVGGPESSFLARVNGDCTALDLPLRGSYHSD